MLFLSPPRSCESASPTARSAAAVKDSPKANRRRRRAASLTAASTERRWASRASDKFRRSDPETETEAEAETQNATGAVPGGAAPVRSYEVTDVTSFRHPSAGCTG